jgi:hypothetical protein
VKGWLALLVVLLVLVSPLILLLATGAEIMGEEKVYPEVTELPEWVTTKKIAWVVAIAQALMCITAGLFLIFDRQPFAVRYTIFALWVGGPLLDIVGSVAIANTMEVPVVDVIDLPGVVPGTIGTMLWTLYLLVSVRVANTYYNGAQQPSML